MQKPLAVITGASSGIGEVFARKLAVKYDLLIGWRHKLVVAVLRAAPFWLQIRLARVGAARSAHGASGVH